MANSTPTSGAALLGAGGQATGATADLKRIWGTVLRCVLTAAALLPPPAAGQNVSVTDYSVPVSRADNLRIDALKLNYTTEGDEEVVKSGNLGLVYKKFYDSLPFAYSVDLVGTASFRKDALQDKLVGDLTTNLVTRIKKYARSEGNFFIFGDTDFDIDDDFDRPGVNQTVAIGYGRFINATALRKAVRIEDFLLKEGVISDYLPRETMIELGHIIEKRREYEDLYGDRYENYWYEDMSNEITKSGLVLGSIGAIGVIRMQEVLFQERINDRFYGWETAVGIQFDVVTPREGQARRDPAMSIGLRYSRPISWRTQVNTDFTVDSPLSGDFGRIYNLKHTTDFIYEISNRISFTAAHIFRADKKRNVDAKLSTSLLFVFNFFIENRISLNVSEQIDKREGDAFRQSFDISLSYRIF